MALFTSRLGRSVRFPLVQRSLGFAGVLALAIACNSSESPSGQGEGDSGDGDGDGDLGDGDGDGDLIPGDGDIGDGDGDGDSNSGDPWRHRTAGVFVHLFEWPWPDVATECEKVLGPAGYSAVQVSPPGEHAKIAGRPWWERYQPVSYQLVSRSGNEAEFVDMVERCAAVGVDIYVDAVINHMSAQGNGIGTADTSYTKYNFPGTWGEADFHSPVCTIEGIDYTTDADRVRNCELVGLADLNTAQENVREGLANYLIRLVDLGVRGFRIDAAKHMAPEDIDAILQLVTEGTDVTPYVFLEVIDHGGEAISEAEYAGISMGEDKTVGTTEFRFIEVGAAFRAPANLTPLSILFPEEGGFMDSSRAVVFTDNHDTQRHYTIRYHEGRAHELANVFLLGFPYGYPKVISSFSFTLPGGDSDSPPHVDGDSVGPHDPTGTPCVVPEDGVHDATNYETLPDGRWVCEHRSRAITAMVRFRKVTEGAPLAHTWSGSSTSVAYARAGKGFVVINLAEEPLVETLQTGLPEGSYCNVLSSSDPTTCTAGEEVVVDAAGTAQLTVLAKSAIALHVGGS